MSWDHVYESDDDGNSNEMEYTKDERIFHIINGFISLKNDDRRRNNAILHRILDEVIRFLKAKDSFFRDYYRNIVFTGSYYKGTKVGAPDEFDLNLVIRLPVRYGSVEFEETIPGYTKLKLCNDSFLPGWNDHKKLLAKWVNCGWFTSDNYLRQDKFRQWMEGLFSNLPRSTTTGYQLRVSKSGPAFTLIVEGGELSRPISVDLVPVLEFTNGISLKRSRVPGTSCWYAVPKPFEAYQDLLQWRISFYTLEKEILQNYDAAFVKPVIRQIKKLRDKYNLNFASYYIETIFLNEIESRWRLERLHRMRATQLFLHMLQQVQNACAAKKIPNYWDPEHNLISHLPSAQLSNIAGQLKRIISRVEADPLSVANYILTDQELHQAKPMIDCIRSGEEYAPMPVVHMKSEEPGSWCTIQ